jgi:hypothetical protein
MPENNDLSPVVDEVFDWLVDQIHVSGQEWTEDEIRKFKQELYEFAKNCEWAKQFVNDHPFEDCVDEKLSSEYEKIELAQKEVMSFLAKVKNEMGRRDLDNKEFEEPLNEGVYEIIRGYYPSTTKEVFLREINNTHARRRETILKKAIKRVIAEAAAENFQKLIQEYCKGSDQINSLCLVVQTLLELGLDFVAIGKIIDKAEQTARQFRHRCKEHMRDHEKRYWQTNND